MPSVSVDVDLCEFADDEVLSAAIEIISTLKAPDIKAGSGLAKQLADLRRALGAVGETDEGVSSAGKLRDFNDLKALVEANPGLYHFAGAA